MIRELGLAEHAHSSSLSKSNTNPFITASVLSTTSNLLKSQDSKVITSADVVERLSAIMTKPYGHPAEVWKWEYYGAPSKECGKSGRSRSRRLYRRWLKKKARTSGKKEVQDQQGET